MKLLEELDFEGARGEFERILDFYPDHVPARFGLGCAFLGLGMRDRAVEEWGRCVEVSPSCGDAHYTLAWAYYDAGDREKGYEHVSKAMEADVPLDSAKKILLILTGKKELISIVEDRAETSDIKDDSECVTTDEIKENEASIQDIDINDLLKWGIEALREGRFDEGIDFLERAVSINPTRPDFHFELGRAYSAKGEWSKAIEEWQRTVELDPENDDAKKILDLAIQRMESSGRGEQSKEGLVTEGMHGVLERGHEQKTLFEFLKGKEVKYDFLCCLLIFLLCLFLLRGTLREGYPRAYFDATMSFYIAKIKMLLRYNSVYTESWYFGYEMLKYYPPLSTYLPAFIYKITDQLLVSYYVLSFLFYTIFCIGVYFFASRFFMCKQAGFFSGLLWVFTHVNYISFQGHYWETSRLMGTAAVPWALFFLHRTMVRGLKRDLVLTIILSSYTLLSNLFSAIDLALLVGPYLLINLIRSKTVHGDDDLIRIYRGWTVTVSSSLGVLSLTLWWYIPSILPHGLSAYLTGSSAFTPPIYETFLQMFPRSYVPAVQLPITILGVSGVIIGFLRPSSVWFMLISWFTASMLMAYFVQIQSSRVVLLLGLCLVLGAGYLIKEIKRLYDQRTGGSESLAFLLTVVILPLTFFGTLYLPDYQVLSVVDETYLSTDEYVVSTWLAENAGLDYRVYVMWGSWFRGSQWINAFYPDVKQVLGGYDQGARVDTDTPFVFDHLVKWGDDPLELGQMAEEYHVRYIVIDEKLMQSQSIGYDKFADSTIFKPVGEINNMLSHASVYEVQDVDIIGESGKVYSYWTFWRKVGSSTSIALLIAFVFLLRRLRLEEGVADT